MEIEQKDVGFMFDEIAPDIGGKNETRKGRNVRDGYARGCGLQWRNLRDKVRNDHLYQEACEYGKDRPIISEDNRMNIYLILKYSFPYIPFGHIVEFGSYTRWECFVYGACG